MSHGMHRPEGMDQCIKDCLDCYQVCLETTSHCQHMGGKHAEPAHLTVLKDCGLLCQTAANFMIRNSPNHKELCRLTADLSQKCAEDCERVDSSDQMMKKCADVCRKCAESCRQMAG